MHNPESSKRSQRESERLRLASEVCVTFQADPVSGPGQNISATGVYFLADQEVRVTVRIGDREVEGHLVRAEKHGSGKTGLAVRFDQDALDHDHA